MPIDPINQKLIPNLHNIYLLMTNISLLLVCLLIICVHLQIIGPTVSPDIILPTDVAVTTVLEKAKSCQFVRLRDVQNAGESLADSLTRLTPLFSQGVNSTIRTAIANININNIANSLSNSISGSISDISVITSDKIFKDFNRTIASDVQTLIDSFNSHPNIPDFDRPTTSTTGTTTGKNCTYEGMSYSYPTNLFLQINRTKNIFPGSVLQAENLTGILLGNNLPVIVPIVSTLKNIRVKIFDHLNVNTISVLYDSDSISRALSGAISSSLNLIKDNSVFFEVGTSDDLSDFADRLNFNANLYKRLGLYRQPGSPLTSLNKKIILFFTKPIGTFEFLIESLDPKLANTPLNTIFNSRLTVSEANRRIPSWWSYGNPPVYIDSVTYGSMIFLTVDYNTFTAPLYDGINAAANQGPSALQTILTQIASQLSLKIFSLGPFTDLDISTIKTGNWIDYLFTIPSKPTTQMIQPLLYTTKDFSQLRYNAANTFEYCKICASPLLLPQTQYHLKFENILSYAPVILKIYTMEGASMLNLNIFYDITINLTPLLINNQMKIVIRPTVGICNVKGCYKQSVTASFLIGSTVIPKLQVSCENTCTEYDAGTYIINKTAGSISP